MSDTKKAVFYLDQSDEITSVISQVQDAPQKIVALVLPKRAPTFQSVVNIKLLRKAAEKAKKKVVLVTSDKSLLPLAGAASVHVATTPQSKPFIPDVPQYDTSTVSETEVIDPSKSIAELEESNRKQAEADDIDDDTLPEKITLDDAKSKNEKKKGKGIKIPDFNKFRLRIFIGIAILILLIVGWIYATRVLPRAEFTIETATQSSAQTIEFRATFDQDSVDRESFTAPLISEAFTGSGSATSTTTGERNVGDRASGSVELTNCTSQSDGFTVPEGTVLRSGNFAFSTMEAVELPATRTVGSRCTTGDVTVPVQASQQGQQYNLSSRSYTVEGYPGVLAEGSEMSGGTDDIVRVVNERDISSARDSAERDLVPTARTELQSVHQFEGRRPLADTFEVVDRTQRASPSEDSEANEVSVSVEIDFIMYGISDSDIRTLLEEHMADQVNFDRQSIVDDGLESASIRISNSNDEGITVSIRTIVAVGTEIDEEELAEQLQGTKRSEAETLILAIEGVRDVQIDYGPFWVASTPARTQNITITVVQQGESSNDDASDQDEELEPADE